MQINQNVNIKYVLTLLQINQNKIRKPIFMTIKALLISALKKSIFKKAFKSIAELLIKCSMVCKLQSASYIFAPRP